MKNWRLARPADQERLQQDIDEGLTGEESLEQLQEQLTATFHKYTCCNIVNSISPGRHHNLDDDTCRKLIWERDALRRGTPERYRVSKLLYRRRRMLRRVAYKKQFAEEGLTSARVNKKKKRVQLSKLLDDTDQEHHHRESWPDLISKFFADLFKGDPQTQQCLIKDLRGKAADDWKQGRPPSTISPDLLKNALIFKKGKMGSPADGLMPEMVQYFTDNLNETLRGGGFK